MLCLKTLALDYSKKKAVTRDTNVCQICAFKAFKGISRCFMRRNMSRENGPVCV